MPLKAQDTAGLLLVAMKRANPIEWRRIVREALARYQSAPAAAQALGITRRSLDRWITADPSLKAGIDLPQRGGAESSPKRRGKRRR